MGDSYGGAGVFSSADIMKFGQRLIVLLDGMSQLNVVYEEAGRVGIDYLE